MALLDLAAFRARHPEWTNTPDATVQAKLDDAATRTPLAIWGDYQEQGHAALTSHLLAMLPNARNMRIGKDKDTSLYWKERMRLVRIVSPGFRITGSGS